MLKRIYWILFLIIFIDACDSQSTEPISNNSPAPSVVVEMEGNWKWELNAVVPRQNVKSYNLEILNGTMNVGKTTSDEFPYILPATLGGTNLRCFIADSTIWEVWLLSGESVNAYAYRAAFELGFKVDISTPFGILSFDCYAFSGFDTHKLGPDEWQGSVRVLETQSGYSATYGHGTFMGIRKNP